MENEVKFKIKDIKKISGRLVKLGAKQCNKVREIDYFLDTPDNLFSSQGRLFRLRKVNNEAIITLKGPILPSRFKKREEINVKTDDFKAAERLLHQLGFISCFSKEKMRQGFSYKGMSIYIDRLPFIGHYLEIEGKGRDIFSFIKRFGLDKKDMIKESYHHLFNLFCIVNQEKIKHLKKNIEFSFRSEKELRRLKGRLGSRKR